VSKIDKKIKYGSVLFSIFSPAKKFIYNLQEIIKSFKWKLATKNKTSTNSKNPKQFRNEIEINFAKYYITI